MKGLLLKDLCLLKNMKTFFFIIIIMCIGSLCINFKPTFAIGYSTFLMTMATITTFSYDEMDKGYSFLFTLPISRKKYVREKYLFGLLSGSGTWVMVTAVVMMAGIMRHETPGTELLVSAFVILLLALTLLALLMPLQIKFGAEKRRMALLTTFGVIFLIIFLFKNGLQYMNVDMLQIFANLNGLSMKGFIGTLIIVCGLIYFISYTISVKIIKNKQY